MAVYAVSMPPPTMDAPLGDEPRHTTFVNYLRTCFAWGGFHGFERYAERPMGELAQLKQGLLAL